MLQAPIDYVSGLGALPDSLRALQEQEAFRVGIDAKKADTEYKRAQVGAHSQKLRRQAEFQAAMQAYLANPTAHGLAALMGAFPEFSEEAKAAFNALDANKREADVTQMGEIAMLAGSGDFDRAAAVLRSRIEADKAAGQFDPQDQAILEAMESGDPARQKQALGMITYGIGVAVGPDKAKPFLESMGLSMEPDLTVVGPGAELIDRRNPGAGPVYNSPYKPQTWTDPASGITYSIVPKGAAGGGGGTAGGGMAGSEAVQKGRSTVASVLSGAGIPLPVVAGALGNFDIEGGWEGAKGDGGKAQGIAQWHPDRLANYQRAVGKPFDPADHEGQARFFLWEMQNPEAAGMTVAQRDAILNAKTPEQAAVLIDKHYERSSGKHRTNRVRAARQHAQTLGAGPKKVRSRQEYDKLAVGEIYEDPNGVVRTKTAGVAR
jgi:hypothetical protein